MSEALPGARGGDGVAAPPVVMSGRGRGKSGMEKGQSLRHRTIVYRFHSSRTLLLPSSPAKPRPPASPGQHVGKVLAAYLPRFMDQEIMA
ncbi:hypothetical protein O3P69_008472 [Scylla paramamosain]|uniref:Uncharacterized protein n=1 Tax=Scylla paramamosain TaxID=85552 RepID=A0AAW0SLS5_SCYPA